MASFVHTQAGLEILDPQQTNSIDITQVTLKAALVNSDYTADKDDTIADAGGANDMVDGEIDATGYTGGQGGAGRLTIANLAMSRNTTDDRIELDGDDVDWGTLGNGSNDTIVAASLLIEDHLGSTPGDDETRLVAYVDIADTTTNGTGFKIEWSANGIIHWTH